MTDHQPDSGNRWEPSPAPDQPVTGQAAAEHPTAEQPALDHPAVESAAAALETASTGRVRARAVLGGRPSGPQDRTGGDDGEGAGT